MKITFSSDTNRITLEDIKEAGKIAESYFETSSDSDQIKINEESTTWIHKNNQYVNIIKVDNKIVGDVVLFPSSLETMNLFISKKIPESEIYERAKQIPQAQTPEAIYLCASIVLPEYRNKGLATQAFVKSIEKITHNLSTKPILYYWSYSKEGNKVAHKVAEITGLELKERLEE